MNVYYRLRDIAIRDMAGKEDPGEYRLSEEQEETVAVIALLHDVCKVGCYCTETKRRKNRKLAAGRITRDIHTRIPCRWDMERKAYT